MPSLVGGSRKAHMHTEHELAGDTPHGETWEMAANNAKDSLPSSGLKANEYSHKPHLQ